MESKILRKLAEKDPRIESYHYEYNGGEPKHVVFLEDGFIDSEFATITITESTVAGVLGRLRGVVTTETRS